MNVNAHGLPAAAKGRLIRTDGHEDVKFMDEMRKKIIIQEINAWKESRMLPEQYCNYLLTLYSEGERPPANSYENRKGKKDLSSMLWMGALFAFIVFLNYFTEIPIRMQMLLTTISIIVFGLMVRRFIGRKLVFQMALMGMALSLLLLSVGLADFMAPGKVGILCSFLFLNCGFWIALGVKLKLLHFSIAGGLGAAVTIYFLLL
ncbi:hypothetical protein AS888_03880 [Peribacillus simplex]|uniref:DUF2157 domain-containing protein n=2 Tax=Peribacillus TaxID=2675229 RepID=A0A109N1C2_9BACI|nr:hypothetical protein [Peribacillus simplex]KWW21670.1 hypothetical protein AS888_03880 [Peribacillus simplex]